MEKLVAKLKSDFAAFIEHAEAQAVKGNKAAGTRARKASLEIAKNLKDFRKHSVDHAKKAAPKK